MNKPYVREKSSSFFQRSAVDWGCVRPAASSYIDAVAWSYIFIFLALAVVKSFLFWIMATTPFLYADVAGVDCFLLGVVACSGFFLGAMDRRGRAVWPILPLGHAEKAVLRWLQLVFFPWLATMILMAATLPVLFYVQQPGHGFPYAILCHDTMTASIFPVAVTILYGVTSGRSFGFKIALTVLSYPLLIATFYVLYKVYAYASINAGLFMVLIVLAGNFLTIYISYAMRGLVVSEYMVTFRTPQKHAKMSKRDMPKQPLWYIVILSYFLYFLSLILVAMSFKHIMFRLVESPRPGTEIDGLYFYSIIWICLVGLFNYSKIINPANGRELRMLPLKRWQLYWISSWEACAKSLLSMSAAVIPVVFYQYKESGHMPPWGLNMFGVVLCLAGVFLIIRPITYGLKTIEPRLDIRVVGNLVEYLLAIAAALVIMYGTMTKASNPIGPFLSGSRLDFLLASIIIFFTCLYLLPHLVRRMWDKGNFYHYPVAEEP